MISDDLKDQIASANKNVFVSKEIFNLLDKEEKLDGFKCKLIISDKTILNWDLKKIKQNKKNIILKFSVVENDLLFFLKNKIEKIEAFINNEIFLEIDINFDTLKYSIVKQDINSYILKIEIKKES